MTASPVSVQTDMVQPGTTDATFRSLLRTIGLLRRAMEPYFAQSGISASQWGVLRTLHRAEEEGRDGMRQKDLAERLLIKPPSVTGIVDRLCRLGWVVRSSSQRDQRVKQVNLTPAGRELVLRVLRQHGKQVRGVLGALNEEEQAQLGQLLNRLGTHLQVIVETGVVPRPANRAEHRRY